MDRSYLNSAFPPEARTVTLREGGTLPASDLPRTRAKPTTADWDSLNRFAHRTYAPATEQSRRLGAGGADTD